MKPSFAMPAASAGVGCTGAKAEGFGAGDEVGDETGDEVGDEAGIDAQAARIRDVTAARMGSPPGVGWR
jgi:hypothetical protein